MCCLLNGEQLEADDCLGYLPVAWTFLFACLSPEKIGFQFLRRLVCVKPVCCGLLLKTGVL